MLCAQATFSSVLLDLACFSWTLLFLLEWIISSSLHDFLECLPLMSFSPLLLWHPGSLWMPPQPAFTHKHIPAIYHVAQKPESYEAFTLPEQQRKGHSFPSNNPSNHFCSVCNQHSNSPAAYKHVPAQACYARARQDTVTGPRGAPHHTQRALCNRAMCCSIDSCSTHLQRAHWHTHLWSLVVRRVLSIFWNPAHTHRSCKPTKLGRVFAGEIHQSWRYSLSIKVSTAILQHASQEHRFISYLKDFAPSAWTMSQEQSDLTRSQAFSLAQQRLSLCSEGSLLRLHR